MTLDQETELSSAETDALLARHETGVLSLARDDEPYAIPVSYGYDPDARLIYLRLVSTPESEKRRFLVDDPRATLVVYEQTGDGYRSVVATGRLAEVEREDLTVEHVEQYGEAKRPLFEVWDEARPDLDVTLYRLDPADLCGREIRPEGIETRQPSVARTHTQSEVPPASNARPAVPSGIRATVAFDRPDVCPVAALAAAAGATVDSVATSVASDGASVTEFAADAPLDAVTDEVDPAVVPVFAHGSTHRYRIAHGDAACPCACLGEFGVPVTRYVAREGTLTLGFHAADYDELRDVVAALRARFDVDIRRFVQAPSEGELDGEDRVLVDRGRLTARQLEVLETAHEMGYFARPREANATEVAAALDIAPSTFRGHLVAAESKLLDDLL